MRSPKAPRRRAVICASNEPNEYACIFTRRMPQQPTECRLSQSRSATNHTGDATLSPLRFGRCRANVHRTFCTPALAAASFPFVDLPSGDTLRCKLFPADKFEVISGFLRSCMILLFYNALKIRGLLNKLEGGILYV